jgi:Putative redox-active protein (C_GCAxxG_C_C)/FlgD Ig-like domain
MEKSLTRKDFLVKSSKAAVGITAIASAASILTSATTKAQTKITPWPWPYATLDPDEVRIQAHYLYYNGMACCSGVFGSLVQALATSVGDPWTNLPMEVMLFGGGGGNGWGTLCGTLNGAMALISTVVPKADVGSILTEIQGWYTQEELPTNTANEFAVNGQYLVHNFDEALPQNIAGSPLCHASVTEWCIMAGKTVGSIERKERCARIAGDIAAKTAELLNDYFAGTFTATYQDPQNVVDCLVCHGSAGMFNVMTKMDCEPCHGDPHAPQSVETLPGSSSTFKLSQNYPNPFNPSTKIQFAVPQTEKVKMEVYDIQGRLVRTLVDYELYSQGKYEVMWNGLDNKGSRVASGVYFAKMRAGKFAQTKKMIMAK